MLIHLPSGPGNQKMFPMWIVQAPGLTHVAGECMGHKFVPPFRNVVGHIIVVCIPAGSAVQPEGALSPTGLALGLLMLCSPS